MSRDINKMIGLTILVVLGVLGCLGGAIVFVLLALNAGMTESRATARLFIGWLALAGVCFLGAAAILMAASGI